MLPALRGLRPDQVGDWDVWIRQPRTKQLMKGRLCALRKSAASAEEGAPQGTPQRSGDQAGNHRARRLCDGLYDDKPALAVGRGRLALYRDR